MINWRLLNNDEIIINNENVICEYKLGYYVKYNERDASNIVDLKNLTYRRENEDFVLVIDFKNKKFSYLLKEKNYKLEDKLLSCSLEVKEDIVLKYKLDDEEKQIIIHLL